MAVDMKMNVLIVDDYKTMLRLEHNILTQLGFSNIHEASDGRAAIEQLEKISFGLILSDWNMEPMTGLELLKYVRSKEALKKIPFIMVTAESKTENVIAAKQAGVSNYVIKPFNALTLKGKISSVIGEF